MGTIIGLAAQTSNLLIESYTHRLLITPLRSNPLPDVQQANGVNVKELLGNDLAAIDAMMSQYFDALACPVGLDEAYRYALFAGGKRVRPMLCLLCCEAVGGERAWGYPAAGAIEMVHAFSLVHDDLPALDNDDLRRGKPTVHKAHGEAMAILAGDGLLNHAFGLMCAHGGGRNDPALAGFLCAELAQATGAMIDGQVLDTLGGFRNESTDEAKLDAVHRQKTGALIIAACRMGALAGMWGNVDDHKVDAVTRYGDAMGLMFQAVDDLLDVESTADALGKRTQKDAEAGKLTYPGIYGIEGTRERIAQLQDAALACTGSLGDSGEILASLARTLASRVS